MVWRAAAVLAAVPALQGWAFQPNEWSGEHQVRVGRGFSLVMSPLEAAVMAFGNNAFGQLGINSSEEDVLEPTAVALPSDEAVVDAAAGAFHSLFVTESGTALAAGRNNFGQLGSLGLAAASLPVPVMTEVQAVAAGYAHSLFLKTDGKVYAAGLNNQGQLGDGSTNDRAEPLLVELPAPAKAIAAGHDFSYFLVEGGGVYATGNNLGGQLGDGTREERLSPVKVLVQNATAVSAGESHGLILSQEVGKAWGTGANFDGQLGDGTTELRAAPVEVTMADVSYVAAGGDSSCVVASRNKLFGMGSNRNGQLGLGPMVTANPPALIKEEMLTAALSDAHGLFVSATDQVFAAGRNSKGELGDGTRNSSLFLVESHYVSTTMSSTTRTSITSSMTGTDTATSQTATPTATFTMTPGTTTTGSGRTTQNNRGAMGTVAWVSSFVGAAGLLALLMCSRGSDDHPDGVRHDDQAQGVELFRAQMSA